MTSELKVYHVSSCPFMGGAARAGFRLHQGLMQTDGVESLWLDAGNPPDLKQVHQLQPAGRSLAKRVRARLDRYKYSSLLKTSSVTPKSSPIGWGSKKMFEQFPKPDVWNLHWVSWLMEWNELLPWMAEQAPIVWTLHDLNPLKGFWHYDPVESENAIKKSIEMERKAIEFKRNAISKIPTDRITFVGPSKWMANRSRESQVTAGFESEVIPYGLDTDSFSPRNPDLLRTMFDIPQDAFVLGFVADVVDDPRKGIEPLLEAIRKLSAEYRVHLMTVGRQPPPQTLGVPCTHLGSIQQDRLLSHFYSTCNLFACPSLQDNLPNTVLEAMACGTPVVGFETGGIPDMVREGVSGLVANPVGDAEELAKAISSLTSNPELLSQLGTSCRQLAIDEYSLAIQAKRYVQLYQELVN